MRSRSRYWNRGRVYKGYRFVVKVGVFLVIRGIEGKVEGFVNIWYERIWVILVL